MHHRLLVSVLLLTLPVSALTVTTAADELDSPAGANVSLREAIRDTPSLGTVDFNNSLNGGTLTLTLGELSVISKTLTIDASSLSVGITLDGGGNSRILTVGSGTVNILGVRFTRGFAPADGGAIYAFSSSLLTLTDCGFFDNEAGQHGGAIDCSLSDLTLDNTWIAYNLAGGHGGGIRITGATSDLIATSSTISNNTASGGGGGIRASSAGSVTLRTSTINNNRTLGPGGGTYAISTPLVLENTTITANTATAAGGGLYSNGDLTLTSCTVTSNTSALGGGGLWLISPATRTITNTIVARNTSVDDADLSLQGANLTRAGVNFIGSNDGNSSVFPAGNPNPNGDLVGTDAAPLNPRLSPLAFYGGTTESLHPLIGSPVINSGGATALATDQRGLTRTVGAATDIGSVETATPLTVTTALDENNGGLGLGTGDSLRECLSAVGTAGHISFAPGLNGQFIVLAAGMMTVNGDKVFLDASSLASGVTVSGNSASRIFRLINNSTLALHSVHLNGGLHSGVAIGQGGAVSCESSRFTAVNATISECGAIGSSVSRGGAIHAETMSNTAALTLVGCSLFSNSANSSNTNRGGALSLEFATTRCTECLFDNNLVFGGASPNSSGGAIYSSHGTTILERCTLLNNQLSTVTIGRGGALATSSLTLLDGCTFNNNAVSRTGVSTAAWGGAVDLSGAAPLYALNCTFTGNSATDDGGAIAVLGQLVLEHCTISGNSATNGRGGGLRLGTGSASLENTLVANNTAGTTGADLYKDLSFGMLLNDGGNLIGANETVTT